METKVLISDEYMNEPAIITEEYLITYKQLKSNIAYICGSLKEKGIKKGDKVGIISENSPEYIMLIIALLHIGAIAVPVNTRWKQMQIEEALNMIGYDYLIISSHMKKLNLRFKYMLMESLLREKKKGFVESEIFLDNEATIVFTSGSSGKPKPALHTVRNHYYSALGSNMNISFGPSDVWGIFLPLYHVGGLSILFRALVSGGAVAITTRKKPITQSIQETAITHISLVPTQLYRMLKNPEEVKILQKLKSILIGGAPASKSLIKKAKQLGLNIYTTYGSTEMASQITTTRPNDTLKHLFTCGKLLPFRELKIADNGEIMVKGKTLFKGYYYKNDIEKPFTDDGWFRTKDLAYVDEDGYLVIKGRKDNMFISGGENIQPEEIEEQLMQIEDIIEAVVVPVPDREWGQRPWAFVYTDKEVNEEKIKKILENSLPKYKIPDRIFKIEKKEMKLSREYCKRMAKKIMERTE